MRIPQALRGSLFRTTNIAKLAKPPRFRPYAMEASCKTSSQPLFSSNYEPQQGARDLQPLLRNNNGGEGKWSLSASGRGVERSFKFKTFKKTWEFMNLVVTECAVQKHHPEWSNVYNTTFIRWTTHSPSGLSEKDIIMAKYCDVKAAECGEIPQPEGSGSEAGKELADRVAVDGGDCCVPKKKL